ncbi:MAG: DUF885 domain-containing protein [Anaerolineaceae bacterium]|nr:DUF885 domain-containing protein [Anaerolineaceae bacterium]
MSLALSVVLILLGLGLIWLIYTTFWGTPPFLNLAVERLGLNLMLNDPELLTSMGLTDNTVLDFHSGSLTDASPRYMKQLRKLDRDGMVLIQRFDPEKYSGEKRLTYDLMRWYYEQNLRGHRFEYHWIANPVFMGPYPINHVFGVQVDLINFLCTEHKIRGRFSLRRYIQRLQLVRWKLAGLQESQQARLNEGILPPRFVFKKSLDQIDDFLAGPVEENPLYTSFQRRMAETGRFSERAQKRWGERVLTVIKNEVLPAYRDLRVFVLSLLALAGEDDGVWRFSDGREYYAYLLRNHTTTDLTAEEVYQIGVSEVAKLEDEIRKILRTMGLPADDPGVQMQALMAAQEYHYAPDEASREQILADYQAILSEVNGLLPEWFNQGAVKEVLVKRLPAFKEPDSPVAYAQAPAMDGSHPGIMWINLRNPDNVYRWGMRTLAYHEGLPGHIYQLTQAQRIKHLPTFRKAFVFNAYTEGWALYAERLAWEMGLEDPLSNLGRLQALLWRAVRLVVDTGIHTRQWTREEAIAYMVEKTGLPERDVITEVERYIVMPGQACAYYLGYLKILALRQKAESMLGAAFDLKEFHNVILNHGSLPLSLLETVMNAYMDRAAGLRDLNFVQE